MSDRYPHARTCATWATRTPPRKCTCGATAQQSAFEDGKREGLEEAAKVAEGARVEPGGRQALDTASRSGINTACAEIAKRIRALRGTNG
jgi:hypothetical protein